MLMKQGLPGELPGTPYLSSPLRVSVNPPVDVPTWQESITKASTHIAPFNCARITFAEYRPVLPSSNKFRAPQRVYVRAGSF